MYILNISQEAITVMIKVVSLGPRPVYGLNLLFLHASCAVAIIEVLSLYNMFFICFPPNTFN